jgi:hypothetical protein
VKSANGTIQLADLLDFYLRRDGVAMYEAKKNGKETYQLDTMIKIITEVLPSR